MTQVFGTFAVSGASQTVATFRSDKRVGRVDFQIRNLGTAQIILDVQDATADGAFVDIYSGTKTIKAGGVETLSISSAKSRIRIISASTNVNSAQIQLQAMYFGNTFGGNLSLEDNIPRTGFTGSRVPLGEG